MATGHFPSSHGSLEEEHGEASEAHDVHRLGGRDDDGFDSDEFREHLGTLEGLDVVAETEEETARMTVGIVAEEMGHPHRSGMGSVLLFRTGSSKRDCGWRLHV